MHFVKVRMTDDKIAGMTKGNVTFRRIIRLEAPIICPISSSSELIDRNADETNKYA
ncbi:hypothetical protein SDC9_191669 [bioreactor metagenome]|uniref:Uncharacterized protein n=1 Tax=bioreactor metagenome TaxID=1076179 RepID=A0A645HYN3_9ZZZZ